MLYPMPFCIVMLSNNLLNAKLISRDIMTKLWCKEVKVATQMNL